METILYLIFVLVIVIFSMILHELAHGLTAYLLGDNTARNDGRLSLNPLKHIDPVMTVLVPLLLALSGLPVFGGAKPVPVNSRRVRGGEWGFALVAIMGPITNFVLALVAFLIWHFSGATGIVGDFLKVAVQANLGFCVFNILPIPPLDGSRVLFALAPDGIKRGMLALERYGVYVIYALLLLGGSLFSNYMSTAMTGILMFFYHLVGA